VEERGAGGPLVLGQAQVAGRSECRGQVDHEGMAAGVVVVDGV
jgi:hypothetical protein